MQRANSSGILQNYATLENIGFIQNIVWNSYIWVTSKDKSYYILYISLKRCTLFRAVTCRLANPLGLFSKCISGQGQALQITATNLAGMSLGPGQTSDRTQCPMPMPKPKLESKSKIQYPATDDRSSKCKVHLTDSQLQQLANVSACVNVSVSVTLGGYSFDAWLHFEWQLHLLSLHIACGSINAYYCPLSMCFEGVFPHRHRNSIVQSTILRPFCIRRWDDTWFDFTMDIWSLKINDKISLIWVQN